MIPQDTAATDLQLCPMVLHALHLQRLLLRLCKLPVPYCCNLGIQGALDLTRSPLLAAHILFMPARHASGTNGYECKQTMHTLCAWSS